MTWGELKNGVLGLMFSNVSGTTPVTLSDASVREYVLNMPDAASFAFADLSAVCPFVKEVFVPLHENMAVFDLDLEALCPKFIRLLEPEILLEQGGEYFRFTGFFLHGNKKIRITEPLSGTLVLSFVCPPILVTAETKETEEIDYPEKALHAVMYYMAHRLYLEDDISIAMQYLNFYYTLKEELKKENDRTGFGMDAYVNKAGWL